MKTILNDLCYLLLYTKIGRYVLKMLCDIAWVYGYVRGRVRKFYKRIVK